ncbi:hypothetical protein BDD12DRAFT_450985 [Trichophaea hybrida]|nr:hypothetical protein BDD12DRAFT_450985 [Trichophaea hybrida]
MKTTAGSHWSWHTAWLRPSWLCSFFASLILTTTYGDISPFSLVINTHQYQHQFSPTMIIDRIIPLLLPRLLIGSPYTTPGPVLNPITQHYPLIPQHRDVYRQRRLRHSQYCIYSIIRHCAKFNALSPSRCGTENPPTPLPTYAEVLDYSQQEVVDWLTRNFLTKFNPEIRQKFQNFRLSGLALS